MLCEHYPPSEQGGSAESVRLEAETLAMLGHQVQVLTPKWIEETQDEESVGGVDVIRFPAPSSDRERDYWKSGGWKDVMAAYADVMMPTEVVHAQDWRSFGALCQVKDWRTRRIVTLRDVGLLCPIAVCLLSRITIPSDCGQGKLMTECIPEFVRQYGGHRAYVQRALGYRWRRGILDQLQHAYAVVFPSEALRQVYSQRNITSVVIPSPVNPEPPVFLAEAINLRDRHELGFRPVVLFVGKPSPGKGWGLFTMAATQGHKQAAFVHVGQKDKTHPNVLSVGPLPRTEVLRWMRASTFVMIPPLQCDTLPRTALEAQAQERYILATDRGGLPEIITKGTGTLTSPECIPEIALQLIQRKWPWNIPEARQNVLQRFSKVLIAERLLRVYRGLPCA
jgi:glycosyltransferase involved in cell wall biosynthesis